MIYKDDKEKWDPGKPDSKKGLDKDQADVKNTLAQGTPREKEDLKDVLNPGQKQQQQVQYFMLQDALDESPKPQPKPQPIQSHQLRAFNPQTDHKLFLLYKTSQQAVTDFQTQNPQQNVHLEIKVLEQQQSRYLVMKCLTQYDRTALWIPENYQDILEKRGIELGPLDSADNSPYAPPKPKPKKKNKEDEDDYSYDSGYQTPTPKPFNDPNSR